MHVKRSSSDYVTTQTTLGAEVVADASCAAAACEYYLEGSSATASYTVCKAASQGEGAAKCAGGAVGACAKMVVMKVIKAHCGAH